jgi:integrase
MDCSCRTGDITNMTWKDIQFFRSSTDLSSANSPFLTKVTLARRKGRKAKHGIPTSLPLQSLTPASILGDSCMLLLIWALHHQVFDRITSLKDILRSPSSPDAVQLPMKTSVRGSTVFGKFITSVQKAMRSGSTLAGWGKKFSLAAIQHGSYYALRSNFSKDRVEQHMGWSSYSGVHKHYNASTTVEDTQAAVRNLPQCDVTL